MSGTEKTIEFIPTARRKLPPTKPIEGQEGPPLYWWFITEDEYFRLSKLFGRDFQGTGMGASAVHGLPAPCKGCGKYTEFIDWVWTALQRGVHSTEFMFNALRNGRQGDERQHDVYCSECGTIVAHSRDDVEGGAPNIRLATPLNRSDYPVKFVKKSEERKKSEKEETQILWGKWWLDDNGSTASYRAEKRRQEIGRSQK